MHVERVSRGSVARWTWIALWTALASACAASDGGGSDTNEGGGSGDDGAEGGGELGGASNVGVGGAGGSPSDGGNDVGPGAGGGGPEASCLDEPTFDGCAQCLAGEDPQGAQAYQGALLSACACTSPAGDCYSVCSQDPLCNGQQPGAACNQCLSSLSNSSACVGDFSSSCMADPTCNEFGSKLASCQ